jgi:acetyl esterase/lipase
MILLDQGPATGFSSGMLSPRGLLAVAAGCVATALPAFGGQERPALERVVPVPADQQIPLTDFFRPVLFSYPTLNDAGTRVAAIVSNTLNAFDLAVVDLAANTTDRMSADVTNDVYSYTWLTDDHILFGTSIRREYSNEFRVVDVNHPSSSYPIVRYSAVSVIGVPRNDRLHPIFWVREDPFSGDQIGEVQLSALERLAEGTNIANTFYMSDSRDDPSMMKIATSYPHPGGGVVEGYMSDEGGNAAFAVTDHLGIDTIQRLAGDHWVPCPIDLDHTVVLGPGDKPGELIVAGPEVKGQPTPIRRMDAATGAPGEVLYQDRRYDGDDAGLYYAHGNRKLAGLRINRQRDTTVWLDPVYQGLQRSFSASFPGKSVVIVDSDDSERKFILFVHSDVDPGGYFLVDLDKRSLGLLKRVAPWFDPARMRPRRAITYLSRDGVPIEAYLTLPVGASKEHPVPLVVYPHGGPWARDHWGFDWEAQFLASRGYAVLQPNYRGSTDYDWRFPYDDRFDFVKMRNDVTDGTRALIRYGIVDRNRIAIMGGSFGGYLALCGAAFDPDLYRCAVTISGIFDWEQVMDEARQDSLFDNPRFEYFRRHLGDPKADPAKFDAISPLRHIGSVKIPIFVFHGYDDPVASIGESKALVSALSSHGIPYEKHFVERETHGIHNFDTAVDIFTDIEAFLDKNMGGAPTPQ